MAMSVCMLKKSFQIGSLDENDVMFCGQRIIKQGATVMVHQDLCIEDLHEALIPKGKNSDAMRLHKTNLQRGFRCLVSEPCRNCTFACWKVLVWEVRRQKPPNQHKKTTSKLEEKKPAKRLPITC